MNKISKILRKLSKFIKSLKFPIMIIMKKQLVILICLSIFVLCCQTGNKFKITGKIKGLSEGNVILSEIINRETVGIDTVELEDGRFEFTGVLPHPTQLYLNFDSIKGSVYFFGENKKMHILVDKDSLRNAIITGSPTQKIYESYMDSLQVYVKQRGEISPLIREAIKEEDKAKEENLRAKTSLIYQNMQKYQIRFMFRENKSVVAAYLAGIMSYRLDYSSLDSIYKNLDPSVENTSYYKDLTKKINIYRIVSPGQIAPEFEQKTTNGELVHLTDFRGQYLLIDFWASWCGPCRKEIPNVKEVYAKYNKMGFEVLGVSLDKTMEDWEKAISEEELEWPNVSDLKFWQNEVAVKYGVKAIPHTILLDPDGRIIVKNLRGKALHDKLSEIFD